MGETRTWIVASEAGKSSDFAPGPHGGIPQIPLMAGENVVAGEVEQVAARPLRL